MAPDVTPMCSLTGGNTKYEYINAGDTGTRVTTTIYLIN